MLVLFGVLIIFVLITGFRYQQAVRLADQRLAGYSARSSVIDTSCGKMTYIDEGTGEPILSFHGICGGYDQAYDTVADIADSYRILAPSRFGYTGTDMPDAPTIDMQIEAYVELLDHLNIEKTYLIGTSAGGAYAIRFSLMHPERTKGLILYCSGYPGTLAPAKELTYVGPPSVLCHDFPMWFFSPLFGPLMGMSQDTIELIMPINVKHDGIVFDSRYTNTDMVNHYERYDLSHLQVPALIMHAKDDKLADYSMAAYWADRIPDCTFVSFESGGHLMVGNSDEIQTRLDEFLNR